MVQESQVGHPNAASILLLKAIEQVADAIVITDSQGRIQYSNQAVETVTGYRRDRLCGSTPGLWKSGLHNASFYDDMWSCLNSGKVWRGQITNSRESGAYYVADLTISPIVDSDGVVTNYVGIQRDATEKILERQENSRAVRGQARADLVTHIAASLRTPFSEALNTTSRALTAHAELINLCEQRCDCLAEDGSKSFEGVSEEEKRLRSRLAEEAGRIEEFLEDLERLSRPGEERKLANIADLTRMAVRVCERDYRDVALVSERSESSLPKALCYTDELVEAFVILINNATDSIRETLERAGGRRGAIEVIVESLHEFIQVRIVDNGRGIPEEFQDKVFERLFTTKDVVEGFGHGLYLAKEIIERRHGGSIGFTSIVGAGTTFTVKIPQAPGAA